MEVAAKCKAIRISSNRLGSYSLHSIRARPNLQYHHSQIKIKPMVAAKISLCVSLFSLQHMNQFIPKVVIVLIVCPGWVLCVGKSPIAAWKITLCANIFIYKARRLRGVGCLLYSVSSPSHSSSPLSSPLLITPFRPLISRD